MTTRLANLTNKFSIDAAQAKEFGEMMAEVYMAGFEHGTDCGDQNIDKDLADYVSTHMSKMMKYFLEDVS